MAKNKIIILSLLCILFWFDNFNVYSNKRIDVQKVYYSQLDVREKTGKNDGVDVEKYLAATGLGKGNPWCAAFVTWVYKEAGVTALKTAWAATWFKQNVIYTIGGKNNQTPQTGDVFGIYFQNRGRIAHIGFIDEWTSGSSYCVTVEGNTNDYGSREGDGVYKKRRLKSQVYKVSNYIDYDCQK